MKDIMELYKDWINLKLQLSMAKSRLKYGEGNYKHICIIEEHMQFHLHLLIWMMNDILQRIEDTEMYPRTACH